MNYSDTHTVKKSSSTSFLHVSRHNSDAHNVAGSTRKDRGLPKLPQEYLEVTVSGAKGVHPTQCVLISHSFPTSPLSSILFHHHLTGDYNRYRTESKQGTNDRALSIMTTDNLEKLHAEGWPVQPGEREKKGGER